MILGTALAASAQDYDAPAHSLLNDRQFMQIPLVILVIYLIAWFILSVVRQILDYHIKTKLIEKNTPENIVIQILQAGKREVGNSALKWFSLFIGAGVGLLLVSFFQPFGIHSLIIMAFSIAAGFFGYYYFTKRSN